jgi:hypothetical protein
MPLKLYSDDEDKSTQQVISLSSPEAMVLMTSEWSMKPVIVGIVESMCGVVPCPVG